jgi:hypothetical protein
LQENADLFLFAIQPRLSQSDLNLLGDMRLTARLAVPPPKSWPGPESSGGSIGESQIGTLKSRPENK